MSMFNLPNELLVAILQPFSLQERLLYRSVSPAWQVNLEYGLSRLGSLVLREAGNRSYSPTPDDLLLSPAALDSDISPLLIDLFPRLRHLSVVFSHLATYTSLPTLLRALNTETYLSSLGLFGTLPEAETGGGRPLIEALNAMDNLRWLSLDSPLRVRPEEEEAEAYRRESLLSTLQPTLSRLERFTYTNASRPTIDGPALAECLSPRCSHLRVPSSLWDYFGQTHRALLSGSLTNLTLLDFTHLALPDVFRPLTALSSLSIGFFNHALSVC